MAGTYLSRLPDAGGNQKTFTWSFWFKKNSINPGSTYTLFDNGTSSNYFHIYFPDTHTITIKGRVSNSTTGEWVSTAIYQDPASWYNLVVAVDTTQSTNTDRMKAYMNGVQIDPWTTVSWPAQDTSYPSMSDSSNNFRIGTNYATAANESMAGSMSMVIFCDGTAYDATPFGSFNSTSGEWTPNANPSVSYGTNGYKLTFEDTSSLGDDTSGNTNDYSMTGSGIPTPDCPSNTFAIFNTSIRMAEGLNIDQGSLYSGGNGANKWRSLYFTLAAKTGKYYHEMKVIGNSGNNYQQLGLTDVDQFNSGVDEYNFQNNSRGYAYNQNGQITSNNSSSSYGDSWTTNDIIGVATDLTNSKIYFSKNGTWQDSGDPTSGSSGTGAAFTLAAGYWYSPCFALYGAADNQSYNMGNGYFRTNAVTSAGTPGSTPGTFEYDVPTGYEPWSTKGINK